MKSYQIEKMFHKEVAHKKRVGRGIANRASRKGFIRGGVKTQSDFLSRKEKKKLNGEVKMYNKYNDLNNLPTLEEFKQLSDSEAENILRNAVDSNKLKDIAERWNVKQATVSYYTKKFGIVKRPGAIKAEMQGETFDSIDSIVSYKEFKEMSIPQQKGLIVTAEEDFGVRALAKHWGIKMLDVVAIMHNLGCSEKYEKITNKLIGTKSEENDINSNNNFHASLDGEFMGSELKERLAGVSAIPLNDKRYMVKLVLEEI